MINASTQESIQEDQYEFPYHYIPELNEDRFSLARTWNFGYIYMSYLRFVLRQVERHRFESMLDVGCGDGRFLNEVHKKMPEKHLFGIDYSKPAIEFAKIMNPNIGWRCGSIEDSNLFDPFDVITILDVLEHIQPQQIKGFVDGIDRYLKSDGVLYLTVPSKNTPVQKKHYQHFDPQTLAPILNHRFEIVEIQYLNRKPYRFEKMIIRLLSNKFYVVNHKKTLGILYRYYVNNILPAESHNCLRLFAKCRKKNVSDN